jgi:hypothetical protein
MAMLTPPLHPIPRYRTDQEIGAKAQRALAVLRQQRPYALDDREVLCALYSILTEKEFAHLVVLGLEAMGRESHALQEPEPKQRLRRA